MRDELSPLARTDYVRVPEGESGPPVPANFALPAQLRFRRQQAVLRMEARPPVPVNGKASDAAGLKSGDVVALGRYRFLVTGPAGLPALAVYDMEAPARLAYPKGPGLRYYPEDAAYVVPGHLQRYPAPRTVTVEASRGEPQEMSAPGMLSFMLRGVLCTMEAFALDPAGSKLFLIFRDQTSGKPDGTYGAGRFLYAQTETGGRVLLDFNQAWNPLCAYSHYFHCPLPPRSNWLAVAITAGEKAYEH